jgi:hypothetical protein
MTAISTREQIGRQASIEGFANEKILCGILMKKYANVSLVDLPLSSYDIIIAQKIDKEHEEIIRVQSKTATKSVSFVSGSRGGVDREYVSDVKTYIQSPKHSDCVVGVHFENNKTDLYFVPTVLIEKLGTKSISLSKVQALKNNYDILENCKNKKYVLAFAKKAGIIKS